MWESLRAKLSGAYHLKTRRHACDSVLYSEFARAVRQRDLIVFTLIPDAFFIPTFLPAASGLLVGFNRVRPQGDPSFTRIWGQNLLFATSVGPLP
jgi:hypothetical protein